MSVRVAKSLNKHTEKEEMSMYRMDHSDQSEINLINNSLLTWGNKTSHEGKDGRQHTVSSKRGQKGGEQIARNDEKFQMKPSQKLCAFSANTGLKVTKGRDLAQSTASAKGWITSIYTGMIAVIPQQGHNEMPHNLGLWFSVKGFIAVIMVFLRTVNAVV